jgi:UrcA family protein
MYNKNLNVLGKLSSNQWLGRIGVAVGMSAMVAVPGLALAAPTIDSTAGSSYQLRYSTAELRSVESTKALHQRIRRVARAFCPDYSVTKDMRDRVSCVKDVESDLVSKVNHPRLTKIHTGDARMTIAGS